LATAQSANLSADRNTKKDLVGKTDFFWREVKMLSSERFFDPDPHQKAVALELYFGIKDQAIVSPHGHVDPALFMVSALRPGNPVELLIQPDHYVLRMLYSQGISYHQLLSVDNPCQVWRIFANNFHLFRATPSGMWLQHEFENVFGVTQN
jgi:glucuronate isomerase